MFRQGDRRCEMGDDGGPREAQVHGWCRTHWQRVKRHGRPGPPGQITARRRPQGRALANCAETLLEKAPARTSRGTCRWLGRGRASIAWNDGTSLRLPLPTLLSWIRRGWVFVGDPEPPDARRELVILKGARARAREAIETHARNRVRYFQRVGLDEA